MTLFYDNFLDPSLSYPLYHNEKVVEGTKSRLTLIFLFLGGTLQIMNGYSRIKHIYYRIHSSSVQVDVNGL